MDDILDILKLELYYPAQEVAFENLFTEKVDKYSPTITFLLPKQIMDFIKKCSDHQMYSSYEINVNYKNRYKKTPFIVYLTKKKAKENIEAIKKKKKYTIKFSGMHFKKVCQETLNKNIILDDILSSFRFFLDEEEMKNYTPPVIPHFSPSKKILPYKQPSKEKITIGGIKKDIKDFIKKLKIKTKIDKYYSTFIYLDMKNLQNYLDHVKKFIKNGEENSKIKKLFLNATITPFFPKQRKFLFYLTRSQINLLEYLTDSFLFVDLMDEDYRLKLSKNQLLKTYKEVIRINSLIYYYKKIRKEDPSKPQETKQKLLAISDKPFNKEETLTLTENLEKDLIEFSDDDNDLIDVSNDDLIDLNTVIPNPKVKEKAKDLIDLNTVIPNPRVKVKQKVKNLNIMNPRVNPSFHNGENILKNILNYPETKKLLGVRFTTELKKKTKSLGPEVSFGLAIIINTFLTNR